MTAGHESAWSALVFGLFQLLGTSPERHLSLLLYTAAQLAHSPFVQKVLGPSPKSVLVNL